MKRGHDYTFWQQRRKPKIYSHLARALCICMTRREEMTELPHESNGKKENEIKERHALREN